MQRIVKKYYEKVVELKNDNNSMTNIVNEIYDELIEEEKELAYSITLKILYTLGYSNSEINDVVNKSKWKDYKRSAEDLFFDAIELDDDLTT